MLRIETTEGPSSLIVRSSSPQNHNSNEDKHLYLTSNLSINLSEKNCLHDTWISSRASRWICTLLSIRLRLRKNQHTNDNNSMRTKTHLLLNLKWVTVQNKISKFHINPKWQLNDNNLPKITNHLASKFNRGLNLNLKDHKTMSLVLGMTMFRLSAALVLKVESSHLSTVRSVVWSVAMNVVESLQRTGSRNMKLPVKKYSKNVKHSILKRWEHQLTLLEKV